MGSGWIKLHRQLLDWEWYDDINTCRLFVHLMLTANHKDNNWRGIEIKRGSRLTSLDKLSGETNLSVSKIRTSIKKLISTQEIASKSHSQHTVFTMINYESYQGDDKQIDKRMTNESQTNDKRIATNKNVKNVKNENNIKEVIDYLNLVVNTKYKHTTKSHSENISARLNDGYSVDDLKLVISAKANEWLNNKDMIQYLRPSTLFQASKFQGYLLKAKPVQLMNKPREFTQ